MDLCGSDGFLGLIWNGFCVEVTDVEVMNVEVRDTRKLDDGHFYLSKPMIRYNQISGFFGRRDARNITHGIFG